MSRPSSDPILSEVIRSSLFFITREMGATLSFAGHSTIMREGNDHACGILTRKGELVAQVEHNPALLGTLPYGAQGVIKNIGIENLCPEDVIMLNDPWSGGSHMPDLQFYAPVFFEEELVAFCGNLAHHSDFGGASPGSYGIDAKEYYSEALRIPPIKLCDKGKTNQAVEKLVLSNIRVPDQQLGDIKAQVAACNTGVQRLKELMKRFGKDTVLSCIDDILDYSERRMRSEIEKMPSGDYEGEAWGENGVYGDRKVKVTLKIRGSDMTIDFTGSDEQARVGGPLNVSVAFAWSATLATIKAATDPTIPMNGGCYRPLKMVAPEGTVVNARYPASMNGIETVLRVFDAVKLALLQVRPERLNAIDGGAMNLIMMGGFDSKTGKEFMFYHWMMGGWGARMNKDGPDALIYPVMNAKNIPVEVIETVTPLIITRRELRRSSEGPGKFRGGLGMIEEYRLLDRGITSFLSGRNRHPPPGLFGGEAGTTSRIVLNPGTSEERITLDKESALDLQAGTVILSEVGGGAGWGDPLERDVILVLRDVVEERISFERASKEYGVVIDPKTFEADISQTIRLRKQLRQKRQG